MYGSVETHACVRTHVYICRYVCILTRIKGCTLVYVYIWSLMNVCRYADARAHACTQMLAKVHLLSRYCLMSNPSVSVNKNYIWSRTDTTPLHWTVQKTGKEKKHTVQRIISSMRWFLGTLLASTEKCTAFGSLLCNMHASFSHASLGVFVRARASGQVTIGRVWVHTSSIVYVGEKALRVGTTCTTYGLRVSYGCVCTGLRSLLRCWLTACVCVCLSAYLCYRSVCVFTSAHVLQTGNFVPLYSVYKSVCMDMFSVKYLSDSIDLLCVEVYMHARLCTETCMHIWNMHVHMCI